MLKGVGNNKTEVVWSEHEGDLRDRATLEIDADNVVAKSITFIVRKIHTIFFCRKLFPVSITFNCFIMINNFLLKISERV